jgi:hypothetical protein
MRAVAAISSRRNACSAGDGVTPPGPESATMG